MNKYFLVTKLALQDIFEYKLDFFLQSAKYGLVVTCMALIWLAVERSGHPGLFTQNQTISYFFFAAILYPLSNFHPWYFENDIRLGSLVKYLVKPISPIVYYFFFQMAQVVLDMMIKLVVFWGILLLFHLSPQITAIQFFLFLLYCPFVFFFSFLWLTLVSMFSFWITEAYAIRWAVTIVTRFLSGILVPLLYFPNRIQSLLHVLPFTSLAFTPIQFILGNISVVQFLYSLVVLLGWTVVLGVIYLSVWHRGLLQFEANGM